MELQVPYRVCPKVQTEGVFRRKTPGYTRNIEAAVSMERCGNHRGRGVPRPHTHISEHPAQNERFGLYGIFEREKRTANFPKMGKYEVCVPKRSFWCKEYYVDTVGKNTKAIKEYISEQLKRDKESDQLSMFHPRDPFTGSK